VNRASQLLAEKKTPQAICLLQPSPIPSSRSRAQARARTQASGRGGKL
jgi:hypothetical protein